MITKNKISPQYTPTFQANSRVVKNITGELKYRTNTWFFRGDLDWDRFVKYADKKYNKAHNIPIFNFACSDGEESFTLAYKLIHLLKERANKFFPIKASDIDSLNIKKAKSSDYYHIDLYEAEKYTINATEKEGWKGFKGAVKKGLGAVYDKFLG